MDNFEKMTRKQLATYIVLNQYAQGFCSFKNIGYQIRNRLYGGAGFKPQTKAELIKGAKAISE